MELGKIPAEYMLLGEWIEGSHIRELKLEKEEQRKWTEARVPKGKESYLHFMNEVYSIEKLKDE